MADPSAKAAVPASSQPTARRSLLQFIAEYSTPNRVALLGGVVSTVCLGVLVRRTNRQIKLAEVVSQRFRANEPNEVEKRAVAVSVGGKALALGTGYVIVAGIASTSYLIFTWQLRTV